jgi:hypothetical protein
MATLVSIGAVAALLYRYRATLARVSHYVTEERNYIFVGLYASLVLGGFAVFVWKCFPHLGARVARPGDARRRRGPLCICGAVHASRIPAWCAPTMSIAGSPPTPTTM